MKKSIEIDLSKLNKGRIQYFIELLNGADPITVKEKTDAIVRRYYTESTSKGENSIDSSLILKELFETLSAEEIVVFTIVSCQNLIFDILEDMVTEEKTGSIEDTLKKMTEISKQLQQKLYDKLSKESADDSSVIKPGDMSAFEQKAKEDDINDH